MRTGTANLPLHGGKCPPWLFAEMKILGAAIIQAIVYEYGPSEVLSRLSDPFWFQALGCVLGFDWHSSGVTTTVCGALKEGLKESQNEIGIFLAGGKGKTSRKTPVDIDAAGEKYALANDLDRLKYASRLAAKVDNNVLQDGFQIYHHFFVFTRDGQWAVIQQGLNEQSRYARRYHWLGSEVTSFVREPHSAISCDNVVPVLNLVARESEESRNAITTLSQESPDKTMKILNKLDGNAGSRSVKGSPSNNDRQLTLFGEPQHNSSDYTDKSFDYTDYSFNSISKLPSLDMPSHHYVPRSANIKRALEAAYARQPESFETLVSLPGVGAGSLRALSLVAEVIHGVKPSYRDPVRYSFAHGGKDGHPFPVDRETYRHSVECLEKALQKAKVGDNTKMKAFRKLAKIQEAAE